METDLSIRRWTSLWLMRSTAIQDRGSAERPFTACVRGVDSILRLPRSMGRDESILLRVTWPDTRADNLSTHRSADLQRTPYSQYRRLPGGARSRAL
jgi:hypothetical protein